MYFLSFLSYLAVLADAHTLPHRSSYGASHRMPKNQSLPSFMPQAKSAQLLANVTDPDLSRDSCGSVKMGFRSLWTCRDTSIRIPNTDQYAFVFVNSVGWTDHCMDGSPAIQAGGPEGGGSDGTNNILLMKGPRPTLPTFYPLSPDMCPQSGRCENGTTRWTGWPDSPPLVTDTAADGTITAYTWVSNHHMVSDTFEVLTPQPSTTLYKLTYKPNLDPNVVPNVTTVDTAFWKEHDIGFGTYGNVVKDGFAYLYGLAGTGGVALAKVPASHVENRSKYQYFVNGAWTNTMPDINNTAAAVPNAGTTGQGTFYYSERHQSFVWIGQASPSVWADFYTTTAPSPDGPWISPYLLYQGANGDGDLPSYSLQAHPDMLRASDDGIYLTWTQYFKASTYTAYVTPLVYVSFV